jgi:hypothetical protein
MLLPPDIRGLHQAYDRAGEWPAAGTLEEYQAATARSAKAAIFASYLEYRWSKRFRFWENPAAYEFSETQAIRLRERLRTAREIAEHREWELRRLLGPCRGHA